ncbi:NUDIX hydrolase [Actinomyces vulturis]|uniref:NUDIX hydrolase n=1 Tax=Actinomyces vulturis TaxID=1857645 RepID=UPI00082E1D50|nr:NUDIX domain-containing protein [Actinomyces vulturis]
MSELSDVFGVDTSLQTPLLNTAVTSEDGHKIGEGLVRDGDGWRDPSRVPANWRDHIDAREWILGSEGLPERDAARVVIIRRRPTHSCASPHQSAVAEITASDLSESPSTLQPSSGSDAAIHGDDHQNSLGGEWEAFLVEGHDRDKPEWHWIFTVGGGCQPNEDTRVAAARELYEETGITVSPDTLIGPIATRDDLFEFTKVTARAHETFFGLILPDVTESHDDALYEMSFSGWTEQEHELLDGMAWWSPNELRAHMASGQDVFPTDLPDIIERLARDGQLTTLQ